MATIIEMPKLSDTMTAGTLVKWLKKEGDSVSTGDMLAEVETDKATMELESFEDGVLLKQLVKNGAEVPVGSPVAAIGEKGEKFDPSSVKQESAPEKESEQDAPKKEQTEEARTSEKAEPREETAAGEAGGSETAQEEPPSEPAPDTSRRLRISPLARKLAREKGVPVERLKGSGPGGRIVKADIQAALEQGVPADTGKDGAGRSKAPAGVPAMYAASGGTIAEEKDIPVSNMRGTIARRLLESKTQIPHYYLEVEVDAAPILAARASINASIAELPPEKGGGKLSVNDFIMKAAAEALRRVPAVNCSWADSSIKQHPAAHVSFAVAIDEGLITPVIFDAHAKTLRHISAETKDLAWKAKNKKLKPEEFTGGTFCVSNLGMFGLDRFSAIINPPNAAILAVGATRKIPVVSGNDQIEIGHRMALTLSCDHRVVDGATGAEFLATLRNLLENPALMLA